MFHEGIVEDEKILWLASQTGKIDLAAKFIDTGLVDVNCLTQIKDKFNNCYGTGCRLHDILDSSPLMEAVKYGKKDMTKFLLEKGADPNMEGFGGWLPLHEAARNVDPDIFLLLLDGGAEPNETGRLWHAATTGDIKKVEQFLDSGSVDVNHRFGDKTALWQSMSKRHEDVVRLLLERGADPNTPGNEYDHTPLHGAAGLGSKELVEMLLNAGADPMDQDEDTGSTPLHSAVYARSCEVIQILRDHGADPNKEDNTGDTPLTIAHEKGLMDIVDILKNGGAGEATANRSEALSWYKSITDP